MQKIYKVAIVGGGASGLSCAVELLDGDFSLGGKEVVVLERNDRVGKKLIATGNGQGNLTNEFLDAKRYRGERRVIDAFLKHEKAIDLSNYLENLGIPLCTLSDGKKYPLSRQASAVLDIIRAFLDSKGCEAQVNARVLSIKKKGEIFSLETQNGVILAEKVVLAFGGAAAKQFGTDGSSYDLASSFGHKKTKIYPALVQLKTNTDLIRGLKGLKEVAKVTLYIDGVAVAENQGDLLFTDYGVSGSTIFHLSAYYKGEKNAQLKIEFLPDVSAKKIEEMLYKRKSLQYFNNETMLCGLLNKRVGQAINKYASAKGERNLALAVKDFRLNVTGALGFDYAQVTKGGIETKDVFENSFESKLQKGLYIVGEALDVDGDCGGFNLAFAFTSGIISAKNIKDYYKK